MVQPFRIPMRVGDEWHFGSHETEIVDPFRGDVVARAPDSTTEDVEAAVAAAVGAKAAMAAMPGYERGRRLQEAARLMQVATETLSQTMAREIGKAIRDCRAEVARSIDTLLLSAQEAIRIEGEHIPLDGSALGAGKICVMLRFPVGVVAGITPFNAPLNLACHKIAPALAAGNTVILKASPQAPLTVHRLIEIFVEAGFPAGSVNSLYGQVAGPALVKDDRVDFVTFTGSSRAGEAIKAASGLKRVALELGGIGATIVHRDADIVTAAKACATNTTRLAGQSCISVQNVYVHETVAAQFNAELASQVGRLRVGDPLSEETDVGTLVDEAAARRVESWVQEARTAGAQVLAGGVRNGSIYAPTILTEVDPGMKVVCEEIFGPVANAIVYREMDEVIEAVNASRYGLQAGMFTRDIATAIDAYRRIRVGGFIINGTSTWRTDQLAYGGVKASGIGREGPRYAIRDMTEERVMLFNL